MYLRCNIKFLHVLKGPIAVWLSTRFHSTPAWTHESCIFCGYFSFFTVVSRHWVAPHLWWMQDVPAFVVAAVWVGIPGEFLPCSWWGEWSLGINSVGSQPSSKGGAQSLPASGLMEGRSHLWLSVPYARLLSLSWKWKARWWSSPFLGHWAWQRSLCHLPALGQDQGWEDAIRVEFSVVWCKVISSLF